MKFVLALAIVAFIGCSFVEGAEKSALITKGTALEKKAEAAIKKLEEEKKTHEASVIKTEEAKIKKLISELKSAEASKLTALEHELTAAENKLAHELEKINQKTKEPTKPKEPKEPKEPKKETGTEA